MTNHNHFDYGKNPKTPNLSPMPESRWRRFWDLPCISMIKCQLIRGTHGRVRFGQAWLTNAALYKAPFDMLDERSKAGRKREPVTGSEHLLVGMKIAIPVLPSIGTYISDDASLCVNDDCFDLPAFSNRKFQSGKKSRFWRFRIFFC